MSRKSYWSLVLGVLVVAALVCADVQAQGRGGRGRGGPGGGRGFGGPGGGGGFNAMQLLQLDEVRDEIELTEDQVETIKKAAEEQRQQRRNRGDRPNFRDMSDEERETFLAEMRERAEKEAQEAKEKISEILLPHQVERLDEIALQVRGAMALMDKDVAEKIGLSNDNIEAVREAADEARRGMGEKMREVFAQGRDGDREEMGKKLQQLRKDMENEVLAVLSADQRKKFEELKGEPFELPQGAFGRGGPGRGGPGQGQGRRGRGQGGQRPQRPDAE